MALAPPAAAASGEFQVDHVVEGLTRPTAVRVADDGRLFVAEKRGYVKLFDGPGDPTPTIVADLRDAVQDYWDRGLLGLELDPDFPARPYLYVLYTHDTNPLGDPPRWGDGCPDPPGGTRDGCVVDARLSRIQVGTDGRMVGSERILVGGNWCAQYPSHTIGTVAFGPDGGLYAGAGDGASFNWVDFGQGGGSSGSTVPENPCGDPPRPVGGNMTAPRAEGGALRSQDLLTTDDPLSYDGSIIRVHPDTGAPAAGNPLLGGDTGDDRVVAIGLRNPFRFTFRPGTRELWIGDVGWNTWEELNRVRDPLDATIENFGWPCYEGAARQPGYDSYDLDLCEGLYDGTLTPGPVAPYYVYRHGQPPNAARCTGDGGSSSGLAFYPGGDYPPEYDGALFFADLSVGCVWVMFPGANGLPDPATVQPFLTDMAAVDLQTGPDGDLYFVDIYGGRIGRVQWFSDNRPPEALADAAPTSGNAPLTVHFDASGSSDPDPGDVLSYAWDLDGDGQFDDATGVSPQRTYQQPGSYRVTLRVRDAEGAEDTSWLTIQVDNTPPAATIDSPAAGQTWAVGDIIAFSGRASDAQQPSLPASAFSWALILHHCDGPSDCHQHDVQTIDGVKSGEFSAPDHEPPSHLELVLTVTDAGGLSGTDRVTLQGRTGTLRFDTDPGGLSLVLDGDLVTGPYDLPVIVNSTVSVSAPSPQFPGGVRYGFASWSHGQPASHELIAPATGTYVATFAPTNDPPQPADDSAAVAEGGSVEIDVLRNDRDPDSALDPSSLSVADPPGLGTATVLDSGRLAYDSTGGYGTDEFDYEVCDDDQPVLCATATVTVAVNARPATMVDRVAVAPGAEVTVDVVANDDDPDGELDHGSLTVEGPPANGSAAVANGRVVYTNDGTEGPDALTYTICDRGAPTACSTGRLEVDVQSEPDLPPPDDGDPGDGDPDGGPSDDGDPDGGSDARPAVERVAGPDRFATAAAVARDAFPDGAATVYVATGTDFPDGLATAPLAAAEDAPLLLVAPDGVPTSTADEISRLAPRRIVVVGGPAAVPDAVVTALADLVQLPDGQRPAVQRVGGADRYATAAALAAVLSPGRAGTVYVATGEGFPDALTAGAVAAADGAPLLLVHGRGVPTTTVEQLERLQPDRIVLLGGEAAVPGPVAAQLAGIGTVQRVAGTDRFATAATLATTRYPQGTSEVVLTTGLVFADALSAGPVAARAGAPILLAAPDLAPAPTLAAVAELRPARLLVVGGPAAVSDAVVTELAGAGLAQR